MHTALWYLVIDPVCVASFGHQCCNGRVGLFLFFSHIAFTLKSGGRKESWKVYWRRWIFDLALEGWNWLRLANRNQNHIPEWILQEWGQRLASDPQAIFSPLWLISILLSSLFPFIILKWWKSSIAMTTQYSRELLLLCFLFRSGVCQGHLSKYFLFPSYRCLSHFH